MRSAQRLRADDPDTEGLAQALDRLAVIAHAVELTYRAAERRMRDRGVAAQIWACAEQTHELYRVLRERVEAMGGVPGRSPTFPRFAEHINDRGVLGALLTLESGLRRACAHVQTETIDDASLLRDLHAAVCASTHREAWLQSLIASD